MADFDIDKFEESLNKDDTTLVGSTAASFGVPDDVMDMSKDAAKYIPSNVLGGVGDKVAEAQDIAKGYVKKAVGWISFGTGIYEAITDDDSGKTKITSDAGWVGKSKSNKKLSDGLDGWMGAAAKAIETGNDLYTNVKGKIDLAKDIIEGIEEFFEEEKLTSEGQISEAEELFQASKAQLEEAQDFIEAADQVLAVVNSTLAERAADPSLEPIFSDSPEFDEFLDGTDFQRGATVDPGLYDDQTFRLTYGPPLSTKGQYILTSDGLYYDSQSGGLDPVNLAISGVVPAGDAWKYDYAPNLGGRGDSISLKEINKFTDNIFDPDLIDDSVGLQSYYDADSTLQMLIQQRDKKVYDMSGILADYQLSYGEESSITKNYRESIISTSIRMTDTVNKRKKQIEVAVKVPQIYGDGEVVFGPGEIPVNNFSVLKEYNVSVDLEKQKKLAFSQADVGDIVLPLEAVYVKPSAQPDSISYTHLSVPKVGIDSIVYESDTSAPVLSLTDGVSTDGLVAIYNFLETKTVTPSSTEFFVTNSFGDNQYNNAQLNSTNASSVFPKGLGIPYLDGIVRNKEAVPTSTSAMGNFYKLPDTKEFRELMYGSEGFTIEFWTHVKDIDTSATWGTGELSSLTRCVLASENVGVKDGVSSLDNLGNLRDLDYIGPDKGDNFVRGFVLGFTRDRRITQNAGFSNDPADNPVTATRFFLAPTQARDASSASWVNKSDCLTDTEYYGLSVDLDTSSAGGKKISACSDEFVHCSITIDPQKDKARIYADGEIVAEDTVTGAFGTLPKEPLNLPSLKKNNSFEYAASSTDGPTTIHGGPKLNLFNTPTIVGGGYTDGMALSGNFLGGDRGGVVSKLDGYIGSLKFYKRPLEPTEVKTNYETQQGFFKNIDMKYDLAITPLSSNLYYGPPNELTTSAHMFDFYPAKRRLPGGNPTLIYFHPGGGIGGSKSVVNPELVRRYIDFDINVISVNYRLLNSTGEIDEFDTYPIKYPVLTAGKGFGSDVDSSAALLPINDGATPLTLSGNGTVSNFKNALLDATRVIQHVKYHAETYHVDKDKIIMSGESYGAGLAFWALACPDLPADTSATNDPVLQESTKVYAGILESAAYDLEHQGGSFDMSRYPAAKGQLLPAGKTIYNMSGSQYVPSSVPELANEVVSPTSGNSFIVDEVSGFKSALLDGLTPHTKYSVGFFLKNFGDEGLGWSSKIQNYENSATFNDWGTIPGLKVNCELKNAPIESRLYWTPTRHMVSAGEMGDPAYGLDHLGFGKLDNSGIPLLFYGSYASLSSANLHDDADWKITIRDSTKLALSATFGVDFFQQLPPTSSLENWYDSVGLASVIPTLQANPNLSGILQVSGFDWPDPDDPTRPNTWSVSSIHQHHGGTPFFIPDPTRNIDLSTPGYTVDSSDLGNNGYWSDKYISSDEHDPIYGIKIAEEVKAKYPGSTMHQTYTSAIHVGPDIYLYPGITTEFETFIKEAVGPNGETREELGFNEKADWIVRVLAEEDSYFSKYIGTLELLPESDRDIY